MVEDVRRDGGATAEVSEESSGSRRLKLWWQPHAAHLREVGSEDVKVGDGMNSLQTSSA